MGSQATQFFIWSSSFLASNIRIPWRERKNRDCLASARVSDSMRLGQSVRICTLKFPGDAGAAGRRTYIYSVPLIYFLHGFIRVNFLVRRI